MKSARAPATDRPSSKRSPATSLLQRWAHSNLELLSLSGGILVWELAGRILGFPWLPPISAVVAKLIELVMAGRILDDLLTSLTSLALGVALALGTGLPLGALMGRFKRVDQALSMYVYAFFVSPMIVFVPVFFAIFGLARSAIVAVVFMYTVFVVVINTRTAVTSVHRSLTEMARSYGASESAVFFRVVLPAALPLIFAGIQLGVGRGVKGMINGEMFIALVGLGALSQSFSGRFDATGALSVVVVILFVALVVNYLIHVLDTRINHWTEA